MRSVAFDKHLARAISSAEARLHMTRKPDDAPRDAHAYAQHDKALFVAEAQTQRAPSPTNPSRGPLMGTMSASPTSHSRVTSSDARMRSSPMEVANSNFERHISVPRTRPSMDMLKLASTPTPPHGEANSLDKLHDAVDAKVRKALEMVTILSTLSEERWSSLEAGQADLHKQLEGLKGQSDAMSLSSGSITPLAQDQSRGGVERNVFTSLSGLRHEIEVLRTQLGMISSAKESDQTIGSAIEELKQSMKQAFREDLSNIRKDMDQMGKGFGEVKKRLNDNAEVQRAVEINMQSQIDVRAHEMKDLEIVVRTSQNEITRLGAVCVQRADFHAALDVERKSRHELVQSLTAGLQGSGLVQSQASRDVSDADLERRVELCLQAALQDRDSQASGLQKQLDELSAQCRRLEEGARQQLEESLDEHRNATHRRLGELETSMTCRLGELGAKTKAVAGDTAALRDELSQTMATRIEGAQRGVEAQAADLRQKLLQLSERLSGLEEGSRREGEEVGRNDLLAQVEKVEQKLRSVEELPNELKGFVQKRLEEQSARTEGRLNELRADEKLQALQNELRRMLDENLQEHRSATERRVNEIQADDKLQALHNDVQSLVRCLEEQRIATEGRFSEIGAVRNDFKNYVDEALQEHRIQTEGRLNVLGDNQNLKQHLDTTLQNLEKSLQEHRTSTEQRLRELGDQHDLKQHLDSTLQHLENSLLEHRSSTLRRFEELAAPSPAPNTDLLKTELLECLDDRLQKLQDENGDSKQDTSQMRDEIKQVADNLENMREASQRIQVLPEAVKSQLMKSLSEHRDDTLRRIEALGHAEDVRTSDVRSLQCELQKIQTKLAQVEAVASYSPEQILQRVERSLGDHRAEVEQRLAGIDDLKDSLEARVSLPPDSRDKGDVDAESTISDSRKKKMQQQLDELKSKVGRMERELLVRAKIARSQGTSNEGVAPISFEEQKEALEAEVHSRIAREIAEVTHRMDLHRLEVNRAIESKLGNAPCAPRQDATPEERRSLFSLGRSTKPSQDSTPSDRYDQLSQIVERDRTEISRLERALQDEHDVRVRDCTDLRNQFSKAVGKEREERQRAEIEIRNDLLYVIDQERDERINEHAEQRKEIAKTLQEWQQNVQVAIGTSSDDSLHEPAPRI